MVPKSEHYVPRINSTVFQVQTHFDPKLYLKYVPYNLYQIGKLPHRDLETLIVKTQHVTKFSPHPLTRLFENQLELWIQSNKVLKKATE